MILDRAKLQSILSILGTSVGNKVMKVADYVRFEISSGRLVLSTTDFHAFLNIDYGSIDSNSPDKDESFLIDYKQFNAIIKASTTEDVEIIDEGNCIVVETDGIYRFSKYTAPDEFPKADFTCETVATWPVPYIQHCWKQASIAVSQDVTKIDYQGVNYDGSFASTDNRRLAIVTGDSQIDMKMLIPPIFGDILKHCKSEIVVGKNKQGNMMTVVCNDVGLVAGIRLIEAEFRRYRHMLENRNGIIFTVPKNDLLGALSRLSVFADQIYKVVKIAAVKSVEGITLNLSITNKNVGSEMIGVIDADFGDSEKPDDGIIFSNQYHIDNLASGISVIESSDHVDLSFQPNGMLWIDEENYHYLLSNIT